MFFVGNHLVATSSRGCIGVHNATTQRFKVQRVAPITALARAGGLLLFGDAEGTIASVDLEKFPLRMKDDDLLVTRLYRDPNGEAITALSVYNAPSDHGLEVAYGTSAGAVRVIIQHPETVGQPPQLFQTYAAHLSSVRCVLLSERFLISVCEEGNHVRTWKIARFRSRISVQPGSQAVASFGLHYGSSGDNNGLWCRPQGAADQIQVFLQRVISDTDQLL
eukprot:UC1_evm1s871